MTESLLYYDFDQYIKVSIDLVCTCSSTTKHIYTQRLLNLLISDTTANFCFVPLSWVGILSHKLSQCTTVLYRKLVYFRWFLATLVTAISFIMSVTAIALVEFMSYWTDQKTHQVLQPYKGISSLFSGYINKLNCCFVFYSVLKQQNVKSNYQCNIFNLLIVLVQQILSLIWFLELFAIQLCDHYWIMLKPYFYSQNWVQQQASSMLYLRCFIYKSHMQLGWR